MDNLRQLVQPLVRNSDDTEVRLNRTEWEVGCLCLGTAQTVEKRGLADIRQSYYTTF